MSRAKLLAALGEVGREHSNAEIMFHAVVGEQLGLSDVESKTIDLLDREGPLTAGELAQRTGLAPASVTGLIDRLVRKGFVRRTAHPEDRRRVNVELDRERASTYAPLFDEIAAGFGELYAGYSDAELELILGYLRRSVRILTGAARSAGSGRS